MEADTRQLYYRESVCGVCEGFLWLWQVCLTGYFSYYTQML